MVRGRRLTRIAVVPERFATAKIRRRPPARGSESALRVVVATRGVPLRVA